jgi:hypothetical protein
MESESKRRRSAQGSISHATDSIGCSHIEELIRTGGQIMIGTMQPIKHSAVAHDGKRTLAMLRYEPTESMSSILARLEDAIKSAKATGQRVDEINSSQSDTRYKYR